MTSFHPIFNNILLKIIKEEQVIALPEDEVQTKPIRGEVIEVGTGTSDFPMQVHPQMTVWFHQKNAKNLVLSGTGKREDEEVFCLLDQRDILVVEEDE